MVQGASKAGEDIRQAGSDIRAGQPVLQAGDMLGPAEIGLLATVGAAQVKVSLSLQQTDLACGVHAHGSPDHQQLLSCCIAFGCADNRCPHSFALSSNMQWSETNRYHQLADKRPSGETNVSDLWLFHICDKALYALPFCCCVVTTHKGYSARAVFSNSQLAVEHCVATSNGRYCKCTHRLRLAPNVSRYSASIPILDPIHCLILFAAGAWAAHCGCIVDW